MEARAYSNERDNMRSAIEALRRDGRITLSAVASATGINRAQISQYVSGKYVPSDEQRAAIGAYLEEIDGVQPSAQPEPVPATVPQTVQADPTQAAERRFGLGGKVYYTRDYARAVARLDEVREYRAMCVMIGHPGTGKTTVLREYSRTHDNTYYVDCWPFMGTRDLLEAVADAIGITLKNGTRHRMELQILEALRQRPGTMLIYDEAENLIGDNVKKIETLRKLCDDSYQPEIRGSGTACLLAGTKVLEEALTRGGNGRLNLAQIYRRNTAIPMDGVNADEVGEMLSGYDVDPAAKAELTRIATDVRHGGMGNFVQILNICLNIAQGGAVTREVLRNAMKYKLMPR